MRSTTNVRPPFRQPENMSSTTLSGDEESAHESRRALASDCATPGLVERDGFEEAKGGVWHILRIARMAGMPGKISKSGNEWSLEEIPAEEEVLARRKEVLGGRGGGPGRPGRRPLGGRGGGWAVPEKLPGEAEFSPRGPPWGGPR